MKQTKSIILLFLTAMIWGFAFVAQNVVVGEMSGYMFNGIRFLLGALSLLPVVLILENEKRDIGRFKITLLYGTLTGLALFVASNLQQIGIEFGAGSGKAGFLTGLYTVFVPVAYFIFFKKNVNVLTWVGVVMAIIGLFLITMKENEIISFTKGEILVITGAFFWTAHIILIDKFVEKVSPIKFSMVQFVVCGVLSLLLGVVLKKTMFSFEASAIIPLLYGGILSAGVAYTCQVLGQRNANPTVASIILSTESVFASIGGAIILHERMLPRGYVGCALIFVAIILSQIKQGGK